MNRILISCALSIFTSSAFAQSATLEGAQELAKNNDLAGAKKAIDEVVTTLKDENVGKAWFTKGYIYQRIADDNKMRASVPNALPQAYDAYKKFLVTEKKLDLSLAKDNLVSLIGSFYNNGVAAYNEKKYSEAVAAFDYVNEVKDLDKEGKFFGTDKSIDSMAAQMKMYKAYCLYSDKKETESIPFFEEALSNPLTKDANMYLTLSSIYQNNENREKSLSTIQKGLQAFPSNQDLKKEEINYYLLSNKQDELVKKLEDFTSKDAATDPAYLFSLATAYDNLIKDKITSNVEGTRKKAIATYEKAIGLDAKNGDYVYNLAAIYFNQAVEVNADVNKNKDNRTEADRLKKNREDYLKKAMPLLEKCTSLYEGAGMREADKQNYKAALRSLEKTYEILKMTTQKDAVSKKLVGLKDF